MNDVEQLLTEAAMEITQLRQTNNYLSAKVQMFDDVMLLVKTRVPDYGGMACKADVVYALNKKAAEYKNAAVSPLQKQDPPGNSKSGPRTSFNSDNL